MPTLRPGEHCVRLADLRRLERTNLLLYESERQDELGPIVLARRAGPPVVLAQSMLARALGVAMPGAGTVLSWGKQVLRRLEYRLPDLGGEVRSRQRYPIKLATDIEDDFDPIERALAADLDADGSQELVIRRRSGISVYRRGRRLWQLDFPFFKDRPGRNLSMQGDSYQRVDLPGGAQVVLFGLERSITGDEDDEPPGKRSEFDRLVDQGAALSVVLVSRNGIQQVFLDRGLELIRRPGWNDEPSWTEHRPVAVGALLPPGAATLTDLLVLSVHKYHMDQDAEPLYSLSRHDPTGKLRGPARLVDIPLSEWIPTWFANLPGSAEALMVEELGTSGQALWVVDFEAEQDWIRRLQLDPFEAPTFIAQLPHDPPLILVQSGRSILALDTRNRFYRREAGRLLPGTEPAALFELPAHDWAESVRVVPVQGDPNALVAIYLRKPFPAQGHPEGRSLFHLVDLDGGPERTVRLDGLHPLDDDCRCIRWKERVLCFSALAGTDPEEVGLSNLDPGYYLVSL